MEALRWLDENNDGVISEAEATGSTSAGSGGGRNSGQTGRGNQGRGQGGGQGGGQGQGQGQPVGRTVDSRTVVVSSRQPWTDTGIDVVGADFLWIRASGSIHFSGNARDVAVADGAAGRAATARAPMPNIEIGALIGRVGNGAPFFVGSQADGIRVPRGGRLYLGTNDDVLDDNRGDFRVSITVSRAPESR
jgi:hypothetical protein